MSAAAVMAVVLLLFFLVGVAVGVLVVIALSARRAHHAVRQTRPVTGAWHLPGPDTEQGGPDEPPWWQARGDN
jgi:MFS superfamily sulfate permease-like transporter